MGALGITSMATFGWIIVGVALIAGAAYLIIDNWKPISGWFSNLWNGVKSYFSTTWTIIKNLFSWTPLGMIISNWGAISPYFSRLWNGVKSFFSTTWTVIKNLFSWTPIGMIISNWGAISSTFKAIIKKISKPFIVFFDWIESKFKSVGKILSTMGLALGLSVPAVATTPHPTKPKPPLVKPAPKEKGFFDKVGDGISFLANNNSSMLTEPKPAAVKQKITSVPSRSSTTRNNVTVNISNPNFANKEHAAATQKQIDEQVRKALAKHANDKKDRSYS
jgi:hypothetical protein